MYLTATKLSLVNFRSYAKAEFGLSEHTVFVGPNAVGKTNLLEALYVLASGKSFRADRELEMIRWGETQARIELGLTRDDISHTLTAELSAGSRTVSKRFLVDTNRRRAKELGAFAPMVLFSADDIRLVDGAPGRRRRALDLAIGQSSPAYHEASGRYARALASRNRVLEQIHTGEATQTELEVWDDQLVGAGQTLIDERIRFAEYANAQLTERYAAIAETSTKPTAKSTDLAMAYEPLTTDLAADLPERRAQDLAVGTTTIGPHRDDWRLLLGNRPLSSFGSGGEYRSAMLALRMAEAAWIDAEVGVRPILLLDDVFSELDAARRAALLGHLPESQVIITTPEAGVLPKSFASEATVVDLGDKSRV